MKRILTWACIFFFATLIFAGDLTGIKIYINPGHGGYDGDDRSVATIPFPQSYAGETGFWESTSNLTKGLKLRDLLESQNATVIMSRIANTTDDDRKLSSITAEASAANVDAYLSIHSNAAGATTAVNYLYLMCPGKVGNGDQNFRDPVTEALAKTCWPYMWDNPINCWSHYTATSTKIECFTDRYGAINANLTVPGFLSEGSFHDYKPETHRLLSDDYRHLESYRFYNFYCDYFKADKPTTGIIAGDIRDKHVRMKDNLYLPYLSGSKDQWKPVNGAIVSLCTNDGTVVKTYHVDNNFNGIYVFWDVTPGQYMLKFESPDYISTEANIDVVAGKTVHQNIQMVDINYDPTLDREDPGNYPTPDQELGAELPKKFNFVKTTENTVPALSAYNIRRAITKGQKTYVLTDDSRILVGSLEDGVFAELKMPAHTKSLRNISDIAFTSDTILYACNMDTISFSNPLSKFYIYKWANDEAEPEILFSTTQQAGWTKGEVGRTMAISGPSWDLKIYTTSITTSSSRQVRVMGFNHIEKEGLISTKMMMDAANYTEPKWGEDMQFTISPLNENSIIIDSKTVLPVEYTFNWEAADRSKLIEKGAMSDHLISMSSIGANYAKYGNGYIMVAPISSDDFKTIGLSFFDITNGLAKATLLFEAQPETFQSAIPYTMASTTVSGYNVKGSIYAHTQGVRNYTTEISKGIANIYATELKINKVDTDYELSFKLNENATNVTIRFVYEGQVVGSIDGGAMNKGSHTLKVLNTELPIIDAEGVIELSWQVHAEAESVIIPSKISNDSEVYQYYAPYGVSTDNNPESDFFGRVYVAESKGGSCTGGRTVSQGLYVLDATFTDVTAQGNKAYNGNIQWSTSASPYRIHVADDGRIFMTDWSDNHAGIWIANPSNMNGTFDPLFVGCTYNSSGLGSANGEKVHGSISGCFVSGSGENTILYTCDEDYSERSLSPTVLQYNIGTSKTWSAAPSAVLYDKAVHGLLINTNNKVVTDARGGFWISQYRGSENEKEPCLIHFNGTAVDFHTGTDVLIKNGRNGALAISADGNRIVTTSQSEINVWEATYKANGDVATFKKIFRITNTGIGGLGASSNDVAIDAAGNIYYVSNSSERLVVISLPKSDNSFTTQAPSNQKLEVTGSPSSIDSITEEAESVKAYAQDGMLTIECKPGENIAIYNASGACILQTKATQSIESFNIDRGQMVIVKVGAYTFKVMM